MGDALAWIDSQQAVMQERVTAWCNINSGSAHHAGIERVYDAVRPVLEGLTETVERVPLPAYTKIDDRGEEQRCNAPDAMCARRRPDAPIQALLVIHVDTVYGPDHPFQTVQTTDNDTRLHGPGVADAKGGLAVMLTALEAFERGQPDERDRVGWTVLLNPDEEISSPASRELIIEKAKQADVGMVYEPALPNGDLIAARKGSGNFTVTVRGRGAHAGRDFFAGSNAVVAAAELATRLAAISDEVCGLTVNVAKITGGSANNVVPDFALLRCNARVADAATQRDLEAFVDAAVAEASEADGITATAHGSFNNPPKPLTTGIARMLEQLADVGRGVGVSFDTQSSGGVCDGNKLASVGLPVVDTLGPVGGAIHSTDEYLDLPSLVPRAKLSAGLLRGYASGRFEPPPRGIL